MNTTDTQNASLLFSNVRRRSGAQVVGAISLLIASWLVVATVLVDTYQRPEGSTYSARV
jgi:hypothetical protein